MANTQAKLPKIQTGLYINGQWVEGSLEKKAVNNPATKEELIQVSQGGETETLKAIQAAKEAFPKWSGMELADRVKLIHAIADKIEEKADQLALIMTLEQGKPVKEAKGEILTNIQNLHWNAEEARRIYGETIPAPNQHKYEVKKQPVGVVGAITPWNFPSNMIVRKIAPAIAAGCTVILKPASSTPLSPIAIFEIFHEVGLPAGVANLVIGPSKEIGKTLTDSDDVRKLTFTGSTEVGKMLYEQSAQTMKKISFELGGHAPFIIFDDADIDQAVDGLVAMKFRNNGQACTSPNRIFVSKAVKKEFIEKLEVAVGEVTVGNGLTDVMVGPLINEEAIETIQAQVDDAKAKGATVLAGGERLTEGDYANGYFYMPTILDGVTTQMIIFYEETFGPVIPLIDFDDEEEVIKMANDSIFGLASYFFTSDLKRAEKVSEALEYGLVGVNNTAISTSEAPFGGVKHSGVGRENGSYGIQEFLEVKFVHTKYLD
ncbi:NAD-dependent succinate-semialdehyde dehydrogenase [Carnobacterium viridans]|uniref:Succinate semialdehyde dehydrogenase n=1 Tax=Carnobacterium viridans TaxID=174587 RepID=A0A1H1A004_9LACT|nr:NAD-dependent succinate-semialdehyde dehydrogenase [Carnobacterium viridans]UDE94386.1 NAD-dependent succinate-semialdehyde dehydrogenase [Carnobacterium viridans]SDQ32811.1 succinate semialdehyde dehydrogenase [Carnobacterium viridans]